jgi:hypothetical protein
MTNRRQFSDLTETQKHELMSASNLFKRTLTRVFGDEDGMEIWNDIASNVLGDLVKQQLINLITQKYTDNIVIKGLIPNISTNHVAAIKAIRTVTGLGLKDAKHLSDVACMGKEVEIKIVQSYTAWGGEVVEVPFGAREIAVRELVNAGFNAN